jgi:hypothetical protein
MRECILLPYTESPEDIVIFEICTEHARVAGLTWVIRVFAPVNNAKPTATKKERDDRRTSHLSMALA